MLSLTKPPRCSPCHPSPPWQDAHVCRQGGVGCCGQLPECLAGCNCVAWARAWTGMRPPQPPQPLRARLVASASARCRVKGKPVAEAHLPSCRANLIAHLETRNGIPPYHVRHIVLSHLRDLSLTHTPSLMGKLLIIRVQTHKNLMVIKIRSYFAAGLSHAPRNSRAVSAVLPLRQRQRRRWKESQRGYHSNF